MHHSALALPGPAFLLLLTHLLTLTSTSPMPHAPNTAAPHAQAALWDWDDTPKRDAAAVTTPVPQAQIKSSPVVLSSPADMSKRVGSLRHGQPDEGISELETRDPAGTLSTPEDLTTRDPNTSESSNLLPISYASGGSGATIKRDESEPEIKERSSSSSNEIQVDEEKKVGERADFSAEGEIEKRCAECDAKAAAAAGESGTGAGKHHEGQKGHHKGHKGHKEGAGQAEHASAGPPAADPDVTAPAPTAPAVASIPYPSAAGAAAKRDPYPPGLAPPARAPPKVSSTGVASGHGDGQGGPPAKDETSAASLELFGVVGRRHAEEDAAAEERKRELEKVRREAGEKEAERWS